MKLIKIFYNDHKGLCYALPQIRLIRCKILKLLTYFCDFVLY